MKLYTEKQVIRAIELATDEFTNDLDTSAIIRILWTVEIPSDEDIDEQALDQGNFIIYNQGFANGAKWMKEQITKQD